MPPQELPRSRYLRLARKAYLARLAAAGTLVALPMACGDGDAEVFATSEFTVSTAAAPTSAPSNPAAGANSTTAVPTIAAPTTAAPTTAVAAPTTSAPATLKGTTFPAGAEMVVGFTYQPASAGPARNPYIAVWVEDRAGNLVHTLGLWYQQGKGVRWLNDLRGWYAASSGAVDVTTSGATRTPGSYSLVWDGTGMDGNPVATGTYVLFVEAAREHGPHGITSVAITVDGNGFSVSLPNNGELSGLSATLTKV